MSALPSEADMLIVGINVCYVPKADVRNLAGASWPHTKSQTKTHSIVAHLATTLNVPRDPSDPAASGAKSGAKSIHHKVHTAL